MTQRYGCAWCGRPIEGRSGPGRPRRYCKRSCRQRDFEARRRARELGLVESDLIVARQAVEHLDDLLFVLACTVQDVDKEMRAEGNNSRAAQCLDWLLDAARPLIGAGESLRPAHQEDVHTEERGDGDAGAEKG